MSGRLVSVFVNFTPSSIFATVAKTAHMSDDEVRMQKLPDRAERHESLVNKDKVYPYNRHTNREISDRRLHLRRKYRIAASRHCVCLPWVMYGRRPRCKRNLTISEAFGCGHVFGL
jgi:hypothetical protein